MSAPSLNNNDSNTRSVSQAVRGYSNNLLNNSYSLLGSAYRSISRILWGPPRFDISRSPFRSANEASCVLDYLNMKELANVNSASRALYDANQIYCQQKYEKQGFIPERLPTNVNHLKLLHRFSKAIGPDFYREHLGTVGTIPKIPANFLKCGYDRHTLILIPEYVTIEVDENSPLELAQETEEMRNEGTRSWLFENKSKLSLPRTGTTKLLKVPMTAPNVAFLVQECLKKETGFEFTGLSPDSLNYKGVMSNAEASHWSLQDWGTKGAGSIGECRTSLRYWDSDKELVPLVDRILFQLLSAIKSGKAPTAQNHLEYTATTYKVFSFSSKIKSAAIYFSKRDNGLSLHVVDSATSDGRNFTGGAAAGVRSSQD